MCFSVSEYLVKELPSSQKDVDAWTALIELQSDIVRSTSEQHVRLTATQRKTASDLKISLYRDALSRVKDSSARNGLTAGLMKEGSQAWDRNKQLAEWLSLMKKVPSFELSLLYLNFLQTDHSNFSYDGCLQAYRDWLKAELTAHPAKRDAHCLYILLRLTTFMKQSGYSELGTAIWQCMSELNFYRPTSVSPGEQIGIFGRILGF